LNTMPMGLFRSSQMTWLFSCSTPLTRRRCVTYVSFATETFGSTPAAGTLRHTARVLLVTWTPALTINDAKTRDRRHDEKRQHLQRLRHARTHRQKSGTASALVGREANVHTMGLVVDAAATAASNSSITLACGIELHTSDACMAWQGKLHAQTASPDGRTTQHSTTIHNTRHNVHDNGAVHCEQPVEAAEGASQRSRRQGGHGSAKRHRAHDVGLRQRDGSSTRYTPWQATSATQPRRRHARPLLNND
jgi:hypothetical protein